MRLWELNKIPYSICTAHLLPLYIKSDKILKIFFCYICGVEHTHGTEHVWKSEDNLQKLIISSQHVGPKGSNLTCSDLLARVLTCWAVLPALINERFKKKTLGTYCLSKLNLCLWVDKSHDCRHFMVLDFHCRLTIRGTIF